MVYTATITTQATITTYIEANDAEEARLEAQHRFQNALLGPRNGEHIIKLEVEEAVEWNKP